MSESVGMKELVVAPDQEFEKLRRDAEADRTDRRGGKCFRRRDARRMGLTRLAAISPKALEQEVKGAAEDVVGAVR